MKRTLLLFFAISISIVGISQCLPDDTYASESFGFWPDASEGLIEGFQDVAYSEVITIKAPSDGGEIDPAYAGYTIDSITVTGMTGLPVGFDYNCNNSDCVFPGGTLNCLGLLGTTSDAGDYDLTINLNIYAVVGGFGIVLPYAYDEYTLTILDPNGIEELSSLRISLDQNIPNPLVDYTVIPFSVKEFGAVTFQVFNMMGEKLYEQEVLATTGENELKFYPEHMNSGIYLYSLTSNGFTQTKRMMIKK